VVSGRSVWGVRVKKKKELVNCGLEKREGEGRRSGAVGKCCMSEKRTSAGTEKYVFVKRDAPGPLEKDAAGSLSSEVDGSLGFFTADDQPASGEQAKKQASFVITVK